VPGTSPQFDFNGHLLFANRFWLGASYRTEESMVFMAEWSIFQWLRVGYAYDYSMSELSTYTSGSHEFMLGVDLISKKSMVSPRFF